jgi:hypothetical protein
MRNRNKIGIILLIIGGIMMLISFTLGSIGVYEFIASWITSNITPDFAWVEPIVDIFLLILRWIADLGGGAVIIGALIILTGRYKLGKWIVSIGLAFGTLTLIIWILTQVVPIGDIITDPVILGYIASIASLVEVNTIFQISGVAVAIVGRTLVKKPKEAKKKEIEEVEEVPEVEETEVIEEKKEIDSQPPVPFQNIHCPNCGASLAFNANFCSECGTNFDRE